MAALFAVLHSLLLVLSVTRGGFPQCYTGTGCTGSVVPAASQEECCTDSDNGMAFMDAGICTQCTGKSQEIVTDLTHYFCWLIIPSLRIITHAKGL